MRKMLSLIAAVIVGLTLVVGFTPRADAATTEGYSVNVLKYRGQSTLSLVVDGNHRWDVRVNGRTVARVFKRKPDSFINTWFEGVVNIDATRKVKRVALLRDGVRVYKTYLSRINKPCEYEDSTNCVWDARHMGNGIGRSFVNDRGHITYVSHRAAHTLLGW